MMDKSELYWSIAVERVALPSGATRVVVAIRVRDAEGVTILRLDRASAELLAMEINAAANVARQQTQKEADK